MPAPLTTDPERIVIGSIRTLPPAEAREAALAINPEYFLRSNTRAMLDALRRCVQAGGDPTDDALVLNFLDLEQVDVADYAACLSDVVNPANVYHHYQQVKRRWTLAELHQQARQWQEDTGDADADPLDLAAQLAEQADIIRQHLAASRLVSMQELNADAKALYEAGRNNPEPGVITGIERLDRILYGFQPGDMIVLAARPSVGKTALAVQIAAHAAQQGDGVALYSLEMSAGSLRDRMLANDSKICLSTVMRRTWPEHQHDRIMRWLDGSAEWPIWMYDSSLCKPSTILAECKNLQSQRKPLKLVIIDYLQLLESDGPQNRNDNLYTRATINSRAIKCAARALKVPILVLSQLSRNIEHRHGEESEPRLSDLRESGAIEQDADVVMFLHRTFLDQDDSEQACDLIDILIRKHRNGALGRIPTTYFRAFNRFVERREEQEHD